MAVIHSYQQIPTPVLMNMGASQSDVLMEAAFLSSSVIIPQAVKLKVFLTILPSLQMQILTTLFIIMQWCSRIQGIMYRNSQGLTCWYKILLMAIPLAVHRSHSLPMVHHYRVSSFRQTPE